jgi:glycosyltransferase involved in cell wall biosynthesis
VRELVLLDDAPIFGGGQQIVLRLARFVQQSVPDRAVRVVCPATSVLAARCRDAGIRVDDARFPDVGPLTAGRIAGAAFHLRRVLVPLGPDALGVGASLRCQVYAHAALLGLRQAPTVVHFMVEQDSARRLTTRLVLRRYGRVVALGENAAVAYRRCAPDVPILVRNNPLLPEEVETAARTPRPTRGGRPPVVGVLGRLAPVKGQLELVDELADVPGAWSSLLIGGEPEDDVYAQAIGDRIRARGLDERVRMLGRVDFAAFFTQIDVLVVPSVGNEGQPAVIVESLAYGRPAVVRASVWSSDYAGLPVLPYDSAAELAGKLAAESEPVDSRELARRFGPQQLLDGFEEAARSRTTRGCATANP